MFIVSSVVWCEGSLAVALFFVERSAEPRYGVQSGQHVLALRIFPVDPTATSASISCCSSETAFRPLPKCSLEPLRCCLLSLEANMRRREFLGVIGGAAAAWPFAARAQPPREARLIGVLMGIGEDDPEARPRVEALQQGLRERGWYEGRNIHLEYRWTAGDLERTRRFAQEIVDLKPDLIVVHSTP